MSKIYTENVEFYCPKCNDPQNINIEFEYFTIGQFNFECGCGCKFKYQYENISYGNEMSAYKNEYYYNILDKVKEIEERKQIEFVLNE